MSSTNENLLSGIAQDFSVFVSDFLPEEDTAGELYLGMISKLMGRGGNPSEESVLEFFHSNEGFKDLALELNAWHETSAFDQKVARKLMLFTIRCNFGREKAESLEKDAAP